jgi:hypothetical protein
MTKTQLVARVFASFWAVSRHASKGSSYRRSPSHPLQRSPAENPEFAQKYAIGEDRKNTVPRRLWWKPSATEGLLGMD